MTEAKKPENKCSICGDGMEDQDSDDICDNCYQMLYDEKLNSIRMQNFQIAQKREDRCMMLSNERLQELKKYVQSIRTNGWISLAKSDDLISLIDSAMQPTSAECERAIEFLTNKMGDAIRYSKVMNFDCDEMESMVKPTIDNFNLAIDALKQYRMPTSDEILWQEIFSLREKLKIAVEAIKTDNPEFDGKLFLHQLNSADYDQLMEELSGDSQIQEPKLCDVCGNKGCLALITAHLPSRWNNFCPNCGQKIERKR